MWQSDERSWQPVVLADSNSNTRNLEVLEVACVFIRIEAMFFPHLNIGLCFAAQNMWHWLWQLLSIDVNLSKVKTIICWILSPSFPLWASKKMYLFLSNSMTLTSFVFTELANTMKYGGGVLYNLVFTKWRHCVSQNEIWGRGVLNNLVFTEWLRFTELSLKNVPGRETQ